jgi:microcystin-dependent protein
MEGTIGEIRLVAFNYNPMYWMACDGGRLSIKGNEPLYALLGCTFGGDGQTYFNLPNLASPMKGLHYIICATGMWPHRD